MSRTEIKFGGLGGQGVIMSGMIVGKAASIFDNKHATMVQSFGPEARGSSCSSQVIVSDSEIDYPYLTKPDILVVMSPDAYKKFLPELKTDGLLLYESDLVEISSLPAGITHYGIPATRFAEELGKRLILNIIMVGFFTACTNLINASAVEKAVLDSVPRGTEDLNLAAFRKGLEYGLKQTLRAV
jgi:2-oxoglutarate ferredoxin oxidoreductase subunit gamma